MRKAIFVLFSVLLMVSMLAIPADTISAKPASSSQLSPPSPAQQEGEETLISRILEELKDARGLTDDKDIKKQIVGIRKGVKAVEDLEEAGDLEGALNLKYAIAVRLEDLIRQLPSASPGMTTAAAAIPEANPLYKELVQVHKKIQLLIDLELERLPEGVPVPPEIKRPPEPEIERPPEMEKLIVYSVKFLCGPAFDKEGVQPGTYSTAINIHNPYNETVYLYKKAVIAKPEYEPRGKISAFRRVALRPDEAIEVDCRDIGSLLSPPQLTAPSQQLTTYLQTGVLEVEDEVEGQEPSIRFAKGFVVIYSTAPLDVVAVYTVSTKFGFSLDVEYLQPSSRAVLPIPIPEEEEVCPQGCRCLTEAAADERGYTTLCQDKPCGYDEQQRAKKYCYKPTEEGRPSLTLKPEYDENRVGDMHKVIATVTKNGNPVPGVQVEFKLLEPDSVHSYKLGVLTGTTDAAGQATGFNYSGEKEGKDIIVASATVDGYDLEAKATKVWTSKPTGEIECPQGCRCLTEAEAERQGLEPCLYQGQKIVCEYDDQQKPTKYCFKKPIDEAVPARITLTPTQARNKVCTYHKVVATVYDEAGNRLAGQKVYFHVDGANTGAGSPPGGAFEATTDANGQATFTYHGKNPGEDKITAMAGTTGPVAGAFKTWYTEAVEQPRPGRIVIDPVQDRNPVGTKHTITVIVYDTKGNPMPNARVYIKHSGAHKFAPIELTTDTNGKASYSYTGKYTGTDTIVATVDNLSAKATKEWYKLTQPPPTYR